MDRIEVVRMELKYCECCGGLLLRIAGNGAVYCPGCAVEMKKVARPRAIIERRGRKPKPVAPPLPPPAVVDIDAAAVEPPPLPRPIVDIDAVAMEPPPLPPPLPAVGVDWPEALAGRLA